MSTEPNYRAMWEELREHVAWVENECRRGPTIDAAGAGVSVNIARKMNELEGDVAQARTPGPDHVPAVRRVVAWDGGDEITEDRIQAYKDAADLLCARASRRTTLRLSRAFWAFWGDEDRRGRLAAWLRHRDEEAGHR